ncbi:MAG: DNA recombination protein RmuC, partial [Betaproteobacteria bacterium]|nr:DNA recombination protein RmuC [Betaproteobacteria bacterium]
AGVGDLKKVLTNVKTRGTWGEVQLSSLLDQILTPEQYGTNVATRPRSNERVEFAIRLPGKGGELFGADQPVWLPIDAKFPIEDYQKLLDAQERADLLAVEEAGKALESRLKQEAKSIRDKYVEPPHTTDFALLYLPIEGLYAEALRRPGLAELLQRDYRVSLTGPTTLTAMLNSLQMGFRTLAIEKRSSEVWSVLGAVKTEFGKFGEALAATKKKLEQATNSIGAAEVRTRQIERKLKSVEALPVGEAAGLLSGLESLEAEEGGEA